jgi:hypothetical protein
VRVLAQAHEPLHIAPHTERGFRGEPVISSVERRIASGSSACQGYDMETIAWVLRSDPKRKHIGFIRPSDLKPREWVLIIEDD